MSARNRLRPTETIAPNAAAQNWLASVAPAAARMKTIAAESGEALYLCDGPVHPDHALLDLCGDALHYAKAAEQAYNARTYSPKATGADGVIWTPNDERSLKAWRAEDARLMEEYWVNNNEVTQRLRRAKKIKATTAAGIYAKALLVRVSKTGATELAMSLARDFLDCPGLRESLWPAGSAEG